MSETRRTQAEDLTALAARHRRVFSPSRIPSGVTPTHLQVLIALLSGKADTSRGLSDLMALDQSHVAAALAELRANKLIALVDDPAHMQRKRAALLDAGRTIVTAFVDAVAADLP